MKTATVLTVLVSPLLVGCASTLRVWNEEREISGVPFNAPVLFVKEFDRNRHSELGENCTPAHVVQTVSLPLGERFYANVQPATFAKTGFAMHFAENGALSQITLNTEPAGADNIRAVTEAVTAFAPLAGLAAIDLSGTAAGPACDAGEANVRYTEFSDWRRRNGQ